MPNLNPSGNYAIVIPISNRLVFTRLFFIALLKYTDFNLVRLLKVYDNFSEDGSYEYIKNIGLDVVQGHFTNANFCLNEFYSSHKDSDIKYLIKIDNDRIVKKGWLTTCDSFLKNHPETGTLFFCKRVGPAYPQYSNQHGGNFITPFSLFKKFGPFPTSGKYPGCHTYHDFVVKQGFYRYSLHNLCFDISWHKKYTGLVRFYAFKKYMRSHG